MNLSLIAGTKAWIVKLDRSLLLSHFDARYLLPSSKYCLNLPNSFNTHILAPGIDSIWLSIASRKTNRNDNYCFYWFDTEMTMQKFALLSWANAINFVKRHIVHSTSGIWSSAKVPNLQNDNLFLFAIFAFQHFSLGRAAKISISTIFKIHNKATLALTVKPCASKCTTWVLRALYTTTRVRTISLPYQIHE